MVFSLFQPLVRSISRVLPAAVFAVFLFTLAGCHQEIKGPHDPRFIVAEGSNWTVTRAQLDEEMANFLKQSHKQASDIPPAQLPLLEATMLKSLVLKKLILARADEIHINADQDDATNFAQIKGHFPSDADFQKQLKTASITQEDLKKQIHEGDVIRKTLLVDAFKSADPTDADINAFYVQNKDKMATPAKVRASRIVVIVDGKATAAQRAARKKEIEKAYTRVTKGEDFGKVASQVSEDQTSKAKGGDLGYFQEGENDPAFDKVAFSTKPGQVSSVFETPTGYEFIKVTDSQPSGLRSIAEERDNIYKYLQSIKRHLAMDGYTKKLMADNHVVMHLVPVKPDQLPGATPAGTNAAPPAH